MNDKYIKTNITGMVIDQKNGAILNTDSSSLDNYRRQKALFSTSKSNQERIDKLEDDIGMIKSILEQLLKR